MAGSVYRGGTRAPGEESAALTMQLACIRSLNGDAQGAARAASEAAAQDAKSARLQQLSYRFSLEAGDAQGAANALGAYAELVQDDTLYEAIADLYLEAGNCEESGRFYDLAIGTSGANDRLLYMRGTCNMLLGRYAEAVEDFAASAMPGSVYSHGVCAMALGDFEQAETCFAEAMERGEQENDARMMLAVCRLEGGAYAEGRICSTSIWPLAAITRYQSYATAQTRGPAEKHAGAAGDYASAAEAGQFRQESLFAAAQCYYFAGDYAQAIEWFEQCVEEEIDLAQSWYYLGLSLLAVGENERAAEALDKALAAGETNG